MDADPALAQARPSSSLFPPAEQRSWEDDVDFLVRLLDSQAGQDRYQYALHPIAARRVQ